MTKTQARAGIYARISLVKDDDDTAAVDRQVEDCTALADEHGWLVTSTYVDQGQSAMTGARPAYRRLLADVEAGLIDVIVVWSADRLYRRLSDLEELVDRLGMTRVATVKSGDIDLSNADGRMLARLLGSVAQRESEKFSERMVKACEQRSAQGRLPGGQRRFGYSRQVDTAGRMTGHWHIVEAEAEAIRAAAVSVLAGSSLNAVAVTWQAQGLGGAGGGEATARTVRRALLRPDVAGLSSYKGRVVGTLANHPAIITPEQHHQLVAILTAPERRINRRGKPGTTLLGGTATCAECGSEMSAQARVSTTHHTLTYTCRKAGHVLRDREPFEAAISALVVEYLAKSSSRLRRPVPRSGKPSTAAAEADALRVKLAAMPALLAADDAMDPVDYAAAVRALRDRLKVVEAGLARTSTTPAAASLVGGDDVAAAWEAAPVATRRTIIREVVESIVVGRHQRGTPVTEGVVVTFRP